MIRGVLGRLLGLVAWLWLRTLRVRLEVCEELPKDQPWVLVFFHGKQWPLLAWKRRRVTTVLVSHSDDGKIQAAALSVLGFDVVRGSSSRGGARGLAALVKRMRQGEDAAFAVDGPRGPYGEVKPGAEAAARAVSGVVVPMGSAIAGGHVFSRAWDRFGLAWPFGRVAVVIGPALHGENVADGIRRANERAEALLAGPSAYMVASGSL
jgi:lysophospholipid acyltransferase (LPLAT)-like uncharacterized protein